MGGGVGQGGARYDLSPPGPVVQVGFSPSGQFLLTHSVANEHVQVWDLEAGKEARRFDPQMVGFVRLTFSPDGKKLAAHDTREVIRLWDAGTGHDLSASEGHIADVDAIRFSLDGKQVLTTNTPNGRARLWDAATGKMLAAWDHPRGDTLAPLGPDVRSLLIGAQPGVRRVMLGESKDRSAEVKEGRRLVEGGGILFLRGVTADGKRLAFARDNDIAIWDLEADKEVGKLEGAAKGGPLAFSADGRLCATHSRTGPVRVWDVRNCKEVVHFDVLNRIGNMGSRGAWAVAFSPDSRSLLTVDIQVRLWEIATARERWHLDQALVNFPIVGTFSPDGKVVAVGTGDGEVRLLETYTGRQLGARAAPATGPASPHWRSPPMAGASPRAARTPPR